jgi:hypothetical protein
MGVTVAQPLLHFQGDTHAKPRMSGSMLPNGLVDDQLPGPRSDARDGRSHAPRLENTVDLHVS